MYLHKTTIVDVNTNLSLQESDTTNLNVPHTPQGREESSVEGILEDVVEISTPLDSSTPTHVRTFESSEVMEALPILEEEGEGDEGVGVEASEEMVDEDVEDSEVRRSTRDKFQRQVFQAGFSQVLAQETEYFPEWKHKVTVLLQMYEVFPEQKELIGESICKILTGAQSMSK